MTAIVNVGTKCYTCRRAPPIVALFVAYILMVSWFVAQSPLHPPPLDMRGIATRIRTVGEVRHVMFAKVHKAASSTVQNILLRFAVSRDLAVLLNGRSHYLSKGATFPKSSLVPSPHGQLYDIMCNHIIFNETLLAPFFPKDTVRVAIVREPMKLALSALAYYTKYWPSKVLKDSFQKYKHDPVNVFINHPGYFFNWSEPPSESHINNRMSVDLGFDLTNFEAAKKNKTKIDKFISKLDDQFDFVMVVDYFDESLVLLRRLLHWPMKDILYIKNNALKQLDENFEKSVWGREPELNSTNMKIFREWAAIDYALYEHYLVVFKDTLQKEPFLQEELEVFHEVNANVTQFCTSTEREADGRAILKVSRGMWNEEFTVSRTDCDLMMKREMPFVALVRGRQKALVKKLLVQQRPKN